MIDYMVMEAVAVKVRKQNERDQKLHEAHLRAEERRKELVQEFGGAEANG